jgi:uncharacterized membrane protein YkvA (DUF1232 family)
VEATRALALGVTEVTPANVESSVGRLGRYLQRRPWWSRAAPAGLLARLRLSRMVLLDALRGRHWLPWQAIATLAAAGLYVVSPADLVLDYLGPVGFLDDVLVMRIAWSALRRPLLDYCAAKGLAPGQFGVDAGA